MKAESVQTIALVELETRFMKDIKESDLSQLHIDWESELVGNDDGVSRQYKPSGFYTLTIRYFVKPKEK